MCHFSPIRQTRPLFCPYLEEEKTTLARPSHPTNNSRLAERIAALKKHIKEYCAKLARNQWDEICNAINGSRYQKRTWRLLKNFLGPHPAPVPSLEKHHFLLGSDALAIQLRDLYIPPALHSLYYNYMGASNAELDEPFTLLDLDWALEQLKRKSAPGEDQITYTLIRNLTDKDKEHFLDIINSHLDEGTLPSSWM
ncbi:hypothetical protein HPB48_000397 [Haemaphysalis longicornis]|uniref:Uncharacterized protein n=1 Tax=Haemaphysalis longicornis TaxID=44386 RepID=A0A9J6G900_HAELO|nr:hypothetical protein HPB48_000397 [Haemaphysalis longicornis]